MILVTLECDAKCGARHTAAIELLALNGTGIELVDLHARGPRDLALEALLDMPEGWHCEGTFGTANPFRVYCPVHRPEHAGHPERDDWLGHAPGCTFTTDTGWVCADTCRAAALP